MIGRAETDATANAGTEPRLAGDVSYWGIKLFFYGILSTTNGRDGIRKKMSQL